MQKLANPEKFLWLLGYYLLYESVLVQLFAYFAVFIGQSDYRPFANAVYYIGYAFLFIAALLSMRNMPKQTGKRKGRLAFICIVAVYIFVRLYTWLLHAENLEYTGYYNVSFTRITLVYLPAAYLMMRITDFNAMLRGIQKYNYVFTLLGYYFTWRWNRSTGSDESLTLAYSMAFCAVVSLYFVFSEKRKTADIILLVADMFILLVLGSRGALLTVLIYAAYKILTGYIHSRNIAAKIFEILTAAALIALVYFSLPWLLKVLADFLGHYNIHSRVLTMAQNGILGENSGRQTVFLWMQESLDVIPALGYGFLGDMKATGGHYAHTIALDFVMDFGWLFGIFYIVWIAWRLLRQLLRKQNQMLILCGLFILTKLCFSSTYLINATFWLLLGMLCASADGVPMQAASAGNAGSGERPAEVKQL